MSKPSDACDAHPPPESRQRLRVKIGVFISGDIHTASVVRKNFEGDQMPRTQATPTPATKPTTHRTARTTVKKPARIPSAPAPIPEFDPAAHHQEIAEVAYRNWLEREGSEAEDWRKAEIEVRARYTR
jgi:hypothetical protein